MLIWTKALGPFASNCYVIACPGTRHAAIIDPGQPDPWIRRVVTDERLSVVAILFTHGHLDHIGGVEWAREWSGMPVMAHRDEQIVLTDPALNGSAWGGDPITVNKVDRWLTEGERVAVGNLQLQVIHTPGHSPGGICFYTPGHLLAGDTLFAGSVGRTDMPGGDHEALVNGIRTKLCTLPGDTIVYPGHGPTTNIADERQYNPFL